MASWLDHVNDVLAEKQNAIRKRQNMNKRSNSKVFQNLTALKRCLAPSAMMILALFAAGMLAGCKTQTSQTDALKAQAALAKAPVAPELLTLREGDVLRVTFPGSPTLDTTEQIRRDGRITMPLIGEVDAAGMTPPALEAKLVDLYGSQLSSKQVTVELENSAFPVYITGMVLRPGKIMSNYPLTALEAIMEAGGFDYTKANLKDVTVTRREGNTMKNYTLNLKDTLRGKQSEPFYVKPGDIIYVPERLTWF